MVRRYGDVDNVGQIRGESTGGVGTGSGIGGWLPTAPYAPGDIVNYSGTLYICNVASTNQQPDLYPAVWELYNLKAKFTTITDPSKAFPSTMFVPVRTHIDSVGHGLVAGTVVQFVGSSLPAPLTQLLNYTVCAGPGADWFEVELIPGTPITFTTDGSGDYVVMSGTACSMTGITDLVNAIAHPFNDGDIVQFSGADLPVEIVPLTNYYVINKNVDDFQISALPGGTPYEFSDSGIDGDVKYHKMDVAVAFTTTLINSKVLHVGNMMINDNPIKFTGLLLPPELVPGTTYYVANRTANDFEVVPAVGGTPIDFSTSGAGNYNYVDEAVRTAILDAYDGILITTTLAPVVSQTLGTPTMPNKLFSVVNAKTSTDDITIVNSGNSTILEPGSGIKYFWDGTSWNVIEGLDANDVLVDSSTFSGILESTDSDVQLVINRLNAYGKVALLQETVIPVLDMEDGSAAPDAAELYSNGSAKIRVRKFSGVANQDLLANWLVPEQLDASVGIKFAVEYIISEATPPAEGEIVSFKLAGYSVGNGDNTNGTLGSAVASSKTHPAGDAQHDRYLTEKSATVTVDNLAISELAILQLLRDAEGADTYAQKVSVVAVRIYWSRLKA